MKMARHISIPGTIILSFLIICLLVTSRGELQEALSTDHVNYLMIEEAQITVDDHTETVAFPTTLKGYDAGTPVTISFDVPSDAGEALYLNPVYTDAEVYANGQLLYTYGERGSYPNILIDPPAAAFSVQLSTVAASDVIHIEIIEHIPTARHSLILHTPVYGSETAIISYLIHRYGPTVTLSVIFMILGVVLLIMSFFLISLDQSGILLYPGLLAFFAGVWEFSESAMSLYITRMPATLYYTAFLGLFMVVLPLIRFTQIFVSDRRIIRCYFALLHGSIIVSCILQLTGVVPFSVSLYYFHAVMVSILLALVAFNMYHAIVKKNRHAILFSYAMIILAVAAVLEVLNFYFRFTDQASVFFQIGVLIFILLMGALGCLSIRGSMDLKYQNLTLAHEVEVLELSVNEQKRRSDLLSSHEEELRKQRHDLRHHLHVIREALSTKRYDQLSAYLDTIETAIPMDYSKTYCRNAAVNALIRYYASAMEQDHIALEIHAEDFPVQSPKVNDTHLCAVIGNLLENAWEACKRMPVGTDGLSGRSSGADGLSSSSSDANGRSASSSVANADALPGSRSTTDSAESLRANSRFIRFDTKTHAGMLYISMDNSFNGKLVQNGDFFISSKTDQLGTGLRSVRSIAKSHGGDARFGSVDGGDHNRVNGEDHSRVDGGDHSPVDGEDHSHPTFRSEVYMQI